MSVLNRTDFSLVIGLAEGFIMAANIALKKARKARRRNRVSPTAPRRTPGRDTPLWNLVRGNMEENLRGYGDKSNLARFLEVPPQRVTDWVAGKRRVPDAETLLRILYWLQERSVGRDPGT